MNNIIQPDKENSIIPSTPLQQLKSQGFDGLTKTKNKKCASLSPTKRLPFAAKDNNVSTFNVSKNLFSNIVKHSTINGNNKGKEKDNKKRLKKYGSILDIDNGNSRNKLLLRPSHSINLPRTKSLILKDPSDPNLSNKESKHSSSSESESESEEEWNHFKDNSLKLKLQNALNEKLSNINKNKDFDQDEDIEYRSKEVDEIPYIPDGYTPFTQEDLNKLSEGNPYDVLLDGTIVRDEEDDLIINKSPNNEQNDKLNIIPHEPLPIDVCLIDDLDDDNNNDDNKSNNTNLKHNSSIKYNEPLDLLPLDIEYNGDGLNDNEIADLIGNDI